jgi:uncharacterized protein YllA (UPF0747 family)
MIRIVAFFGTTKQYAPIETSHLTQQNIEALKVTNTFTVTTGHQLNLFTGPLYFLYKIISTINLTKVKSKISFLQLCPYLLDGDGRP